MCYALQLDQGVKIATAFVSASCTVLSSILAIEKCRVVKNEGGGVCKRTLFVFLRGGQPSI